MSAMTAGTIVDRLLSWRGVAMPSLLAGAVLSLATTATPVLAHPHIWVTMHTEVVYENGSVVGIRHAWTFDEYYSATAIDGLDTDKDGVYSRKELAELAKVNVEALKDFDYFTFAKLAGQDLPLGTPKDYWLEHKAKPAAKKEAADATPAPAAKAEGPAEVGAKAKPQTGAAGIVSAAEKAAVGGVLTLHFYVPLAKPVLAEAPGFSLSIGDPTFFIAFEPAAEKPLTLVGAPTGCRVETEKAAPEAPANPSKPGDLMSSSEAAPAITIASAAEWRLTCKPPA